MNFIIHSATVASTTTFIKEDKPKEYMGIACPTCYKPMYNATGEHGLSNFCHCDNSSWVGEYPDPLDVFDADFDERNPWHTPDQEEEYDE